MAHIHSYDKLFRSTDGLSETLTEVTETYTARFEVPRYDRHALQFEVEMQCHPFEKDQYSRTNATWSRIHKDRSIPLEIFMIRLGGAERYDGAITLYYEIKLTYLISAISWELQVSNQNVMAATHIDPSMTLFGNSVKLVRDPHIDKGLLGRKVFSWDSFNPGSARPTVFEQKTAMQFQLAEAGDWRFEIARYDTFDISTTPNTTKEPLNTYWGATMHNKEWDTILGENQKLQFGESAKWDPRLGGFFPSREVYSKGIDPGVIEFLHHVEEVMGFLDGLKESSPGAKN